MFSNFKGNNLGEEIDLPNGMKLKIQYGSKDDNNSFGKYGRYDGYLRKSILYDSEGNIITSCIEENPHYQF